jgi:hypothetical protein
VLLIHAIGSKKTKQKTEDPEVGFGAHPIGSNKAPKKLWGHIIGSKKTKQKQKNWKPGGGT